MLSRHRITRRGVPLLARVRELLATGLGLAVIAALLVAIDERVKHVALRFLARVGGAIESPAVIGESILDAVQALHASNAALFVFACVGTVLLCLMLKT